MSLSRRTKIPNTRSHADPGSHPIAREGRPARDRGQCHFYGVALLLERVSTQDRSGSALGEGHPPRQSLITTGIGRKTPANRSGGILARWIDDQDKVSSFFQDQAKVPKIDDQKFDRETEPNSEGENDLEKWLAVRDDFRNWIVSATA